MRIPFEFTLEGKDWWKPFLPIWVVYLLYMGATEAMNTNVGRANAGAGAFVGILLAGAGAFVGILLVFFVFIAVFSIFSIIIARIVIPKLRIGDKAFTFRGDIGKYVGMVFLGTFLSIITIGFYFPWFMKKILSYLASETGFGGEKPEFIGKPGKLLAYFILGLWLPLLAVIAVIVGTVGLSGFVSGADSSSITGVTAVMTLLMCIVMVPFIYLVYRWYVNFSCGGATIRWKSDFWSSCFYMLGQICLTLITLGIYWPAACLKLYRYFAGLTVIERDGVEKGRLGFDGAIGKGFGLLWGQALLCIITLGLYIPWGYAKMGRWVLENSWYEGEVAAAGQ